MSSMINLIPDTQKEVILFARRNNLLVKWVIGVAIAVAGLALIAGGGLFYLRQDSNTYANSIEQARTNLKAQDEKETLDTIGEISGRLSLAVDVLSKEVQFSKLLPYIGTLMPDGTILNDLSLSRDTAGGIDLSIGAVDYQAASQALVNLQQTDDPSLFKGADANSIDCEGSEDEAPYVCTASIRVVLAEKNPFQLLQQGNKR